MGGISLSEHIGSCHCGKVCFKIASPLDDPQVCNCSFCTRRGAIHHKVEIGDFELTTSEGSLRSYGERPFSNHYFCTTCGIHCYTRVQYGETDFYNVNLRCVEGMNPEALEPTVFDGATLL